MPGGAGAAGIVFGCNAKMIGETKSKLDKKKSPDLSKLDMFGKLVKIESKGIKEACVTEAKDKTELQKQEQQNIIIIKLQEEEQMDKVSKSELKEKKQPDFTIEIEFMAEIDNYFNDEMLVKYRAHMMQVQMIT